MDFSYDVHLTKKQFKEMPKKVREKVVPRALKELSNMTYFEMRRRSPVRTGQLRNSITQKESQLKVEVAPTAKHTPYVLLGTRPHVIRPLRARMLRWTDSNGDAHFAKWVFHPGTRANDFVLDTAQEINPYVVKVFENVFQEEFDRDYSDSGR